jgi:hypothetical protein
LSCDIDALMNILPYPMEIDKCMADAEILTEEAAIRLGLLLRVGIKLKI